LPSTCSNTTRQKAVYAKNVSGRRWTAISCFTCSLNFEAITLLHALTALSASLRPFRRRTRPTTHPPLHTALPLAGHSHGPVLPPALGEQAARLYQQSPWVYVAINRIAEAAALVPLHVYDRATDAVMPHPLDRLLDAPNPYQSRFDLFEQTMGLLELTGNAYWYLASDDHGQPAEIWLLPPERMAAVPDRARFLRGYLYQLEGETFALDPAEVVHFKRWHPATPYHGLSALEAARLAVQSDRAMAEWNWHTFGQHHAVPAGIVLVKDMISDADFERLKRDWRQSYGSGQRRTAFLRGGTVEWQHIGLNHHDLDFLGGRRAHRDEILSIFGVPVGMVDANATEANATVAERQFIERTLYPKLVRLAQKITSDLLPFYDAPGRTHAAFDDIRPTDTTARLAELRAAYSVLSINEVRARYFHLPPVPWGDRPAEGAASETPPADAPPPANDSAAPAPAGRDTAWPDATEPAETTEAAPIVAEAMS
jgi:HK97 family phage portal protein